MRTPAESPGPIELTSSMRRCIEMLSVAYGYAREVERDDWEFALEIQSLAAAGVNNSELRWLVCVGLLRHAEEGANEGHSGRTFHEGGDVTFSDRSCFILTDRGYEIHELLHNRRITSPAENPILAYRSTHLDPS